MNAGRAIGNWLDRIQSVSRFGRKPKPVVYIDMETRAQVDDVLVRCIAVKEGDGPAKIIKK